MGYELLLAEQDLILDPVPFWQASTPLAYGAGFLTQVLIERGAIDDAERLIADTLLDGVVAAGDDQQRIDPVREFTLVLAETLTGLLQELGRFPGPSAEQVQHVCVGEHGVCSPGRIVEVGNCLRKVLGGGNGIGVRLGEAELPENLGATLTSGAHRGHDGGTRLPPPARLCKRPLSCPPERRDHEAITRRDCAYEIGRGLFRDRAAVEQQRCGLAMCARALVCAHLLENRAANDRMRELEQVLIPEQIGSNKGAGSRHSSAWANSCERGGER
jgi:hypothetical protein